MKLLIVLSCIVSKIAGFFLITGDKSYDIKGESKYIWMADRHIPHNAQVIVHGNADTIWNTSYSSNPSLKIILFEFNNDCISSIYELITSKFIVVDWSTLANSDYNTACVGVLTDGQYLGPFLRWFIETIGGKWSHVYVIGFSFGADVQSIAGCYAEGKPARVIVYANKEVLQDIIQVPGDNSPYVEGESRYIRMLDGDRNPVLVDLHEPVDEKIITIGNASTIWNSNYLGSRPTKVIAHGWNNDGNSSLNPLITSAFLAQSDCNVIVVDWGSLAGSNYSTAVRGVPNVGQFLGNFLIWLFNTAGGNYNHLHLVGHSLGAHVVGNAGRTLGRRARRVTGLDPAGPQWGGNSNALNVNSGVYVEAIHTDSRALGIFNPIAHADFYPNGGMNPQPGCWISTCSHGRANDLFAASVRFNRFIGRRCINTAEAELISCNGVALNMGNNIINKSGSGIYGLRTGSAWPF